MSPIEIVAVFLGIANITLIVRRSIWNYPFGIAMVSLYAVIFWEAKLYSDAGLQIFFLIVQAYGWWAWSRDKEAEGDIVVRRLNPPQWVGTIITSFMAALLWAMFLRANTDASLPFWDANIAMFSVAAQILMTRRYIENWHLWIAIDVVSVVVYWTKGLALTAGLYILFLGLAVLGLIEWRKAEVQARKEIFE